jgi:transcriptional regulator with XRE-family HTH domain
MNVSARSLGSYFKRKREENGLTQLEVSRALGYTSSQYISNFERGLCTPPMKKLKQLVKLFRLDENEVLRMLVEQYEEYMRKTLGMRKSRS